MSPREAIYGLDAGAGRDVERRDSLELAAGLEFWKPAQGEMWRGVTALSSPPGLMMMALTWFPRVFGLNMPVEITRLPTARCYRGAGSRMPRTARKTARSATRRCEG